MKFFEIDEEYLKKGGLITRDKKSGIAFGVVNGCLVAFNNGIKKEPEEVFKGYIDDLAASDWEYISYDSKKPIWKPEEGETYFYISSVVDVESETYDSDTYIDNARLEFTNIFRTEEEANIMAIKLQIIAKLRKLSNVDFNEDFDEQKWYITYNHRTKSIECDTTYHVQRMPFCIYFKTREDCQKAIDTIGEENLKKYYFDVDD